MGSSVTARVELHTSSGSALVFVSSAPVVLGRGAGCHVAFISRTLSRQHAMLWLEDGALAARDLASRRGVSVGGKRLEPFQRRRLAPVERLELGDDVWMTHRLERRVFVPSRFAIDAAKTGVSVPLLRGPNEIIEGGASLVITSGDVVTGDRGDGTFPVDLGTWVPCGTGRVRVRPQAEAPLGRTTHLDRDLTLLEVTLDGPMGPQATVVGPERDHRHEISSPNRAVMLYLLARARLEAETDDSEGWFPDERLAMGIWGREGVPVAGSRLNVLIWRVRARLKKAGFADLIEKRSGHTRLRSVAVSIV